MTTATTDRENDLQSSDGTMILSRIDRSNRAYSVRVYLPPRLANIQPSGLDFAGKRKFSSTGAKALKLFLVNHASKHLHLPKGRKLIVVDIAREEGAHVTIMVAKENGRAVYRVGPAREGIEIAALSWIEGALAMTQPQG